jgi:hypothetical protein
MVGPRGRFATQRSGATVDGGSGLLDSVPEGVDEGASGGQLVHVNLHGLVSHDEHLGSVVLENVLEGGECWRFRRSASSHQSPQSWLSR